MDKKVPTTTHIIITLLIIVGAMVTTLFYRAKMPNFTVDKEAISQNPSQMTPLSSNGENIEQKDILGNDHFSEMKLLDELLPSAAKDCEVSADKFQKQEIKGGIYYYEATLEDRVLYFELDTTQEDLDTLTFSLYQRLNSRSERTLVKSYSVAPERNK